MAVATEGHRSLATTDLEAGGAAESLGEDLALGVRDINGFRDFSE